LSRAFKLLIRAREKLYDSGILATRQLHHPVISVGNLTLGGTGKTPLVIALAQSLRDSGFKPAVLSRGYGRTSRGVLVVDANWKESGDEPMLIKERLKDVPVVVGADRFEAGHAAEQRQLANVFILDDGFQHRKLHRDVDIVAIDPIEWSAGETLLPAGRWREPKSAIARAHAACVLESAEVSMPSLPIPAFSIRTEIEGLCRHDGSPVRIEELTGRKIVAFAGIAKPDRFFATLESMGIQPQDRVRFGDHHRYTAREIETLAGDVLITTEKDAVRLRGLTSRPYFYVRISANIRDFDRLMALILERLRQCGRF
jgi:tetraacyldisaccharide 4'-kinase